MARPGSNRGWCLIAKSCVTLGNLMNCSTADFPVLQSYQTLGVCSNSCPLNQWCHPTILSSVTPSSLCPQSFPSSRSFSQLFTTGGQNIGASASASVFPMNIELISFRTDWFDFRAVQGTQEFSSAPQFESISSLALSLLYGPTLTSAQDYWKSHSFDYMDICQHNDVSTFENAV